MDACSDPAIAEVVVMAGAQLGKSEILLNILGYHIEVDPCPILMLQPNLSMCQTFSKDRITSGLLETTPTLRGKVKDPNARDANNTTMHKVFPAGSISLTGANAASGLSSRPIRVCLADEVDRYPASAGAEGDPISLAQRRTTTFWNRKFVMVSTPTNKGSSRIEAAFENTDKREYYVPCADCGHHQTFEWKNVHWEKDKPETACYVCEECGSAWDDAARGRAIRRGEWRATAPFVGKAGFRLSGMCSPWTPLEGAVRDFLEAKKLPETLRVWVNTYLGQTFQIEGDGVEDFEIADHREDYGSHLPEKIVCLTAGVDTQDDRLEVEILGHARDRETFSVAYHTLYGDPASAEVWANLDDLLEQEYETHDGRELSVISTAVDSGGHHTQAVYSYCKPRIGRRIFAIKGVGGEAKPMVGRASTNNHMKCKLFPIGVDTIKEMVYSHLKIKEEGAGYCHFPANYPDEYFKQLTAEKIVKKYHKGFYKREWVKTRARNEALDCRVYAIAALSIVNVNVNIMAQRSKKASAKGENENEQRPQRRKRYPQRQGGFVNGWR